MKATEPARLSIATERHGDWEDLAKTFGTPYFLYDADVVKARIEHVRESFGRLVKVFYAVKANPNLELLRSVRTSADGLDISSGGELEQALLAGYDGAHLSFAGPAKTAPELLRSIQSGVGCISVESIRELRECIRIGAELDTKANIALRVNPALPNRSFGLKMGGRPVQFGIDEEELHSVAALVRANTSTLNFRGIHVYAGSQCFEPAGIVEGVVNTLRLARELEGVVGLPCTIVNMGGGFGVAHGKELDLTATGAQLAPVFRAFHEQSSVPCELVFELGRYITSSAGVYVARMIGTKPSRGKIFCVVDGGLHHHLAAAGTFGAALRANFPATNLSHPQAAMARCHIAGPSCNPTDLLGVDIELPQLQDGDLLGILNSGSYGFTASPLLFLGRPTAAELVRDNGVVRLGRRARTMTDFN